MPTSESTNGSDQQEFPAMEGLMLPAYKEQEINKVVALKEVPLGGVFTDESGKKFQRVLAASYAKDDDIYYQEVIGKKGDKNILKEGWIYHSKDSTDVTLLEVFSPEKMKRWYASIRNGINTFEIWEDAEASA